MMMFRSMTEEKIWAETFMEASSKGRHEAACRADDKIRHYREMIQQIALRKRAVAGADPAVEAEPVVEEADGGVEMARSSGYLSGYARGREVGQEEADKRVREAEAHLEAYLADKHRGALQEAMRTEYDRGFRDGAKGTEKAKPHVLVQGPARGTTLSYAEVDLLVKIDTVNNIRTEYPLERNSPKDESARVLLGQLVGNGFLAKRDEARVFLGYYELTGFGYEALYKALGR